MGIGRKVLLSMAVLVSTAVPVQSHAWGEWTDCFDGGVLDGDVWHKQQLVSGTELWIGAAVGVRAIDDADRLHEYAGAAVGYCIALVENGSWTAGVKTFIVTNGPNAPAGEDQVFALWRAVGCTDCSSSTDYEPLVGWTGYETRSSWSCSGTLAGACTSKNFAWSDGIRTAMPVANDTTGVEYVGGTVIQTAPPYKIMLGTIRTWVGGQSQPTPICVTLLPAGICTG